MTKEQVQFIVAQEPKKKYRQAFAVTVAVVFARSSREAVRIAKREHGMGPFPQYKAPYASPLSTMTTYHF